MTHMYSFIWDSVLYLNFILVFKSAAIKSFPLNDSTLPLYEVLLTNQSSLFQPIRGVHFNKSVSRKPNHQHMEHFWLVTLLIIQATLLQTNHDLIIFDLSKTISRNQRTTTSTVLQNTLWAYGYKIKGQRIPNLWFNLFWFYFRHWCSDHWNFEIKNFKFC